MNSAFISRLPVEILHEIISYLDQEYWQLAPLCLVDRAFYDLVTPIIYSEVRLNKSGPAHKSIKGGFVDELGRQKILISTLSKNPSLGALVKSFHHEIEDHDFYNTAAKDAVISEPECGASLAKSLTSLHTASFLHTSLVDNLVPSPQLCHTLRHLRLCVTGTLFSRWTRDIRTRIAHLEVYITVDGLHKIQRSTPTVEQILELMIVTCPALKHLDIGALPDRVGHQDRDEYKTKAPDTAPHSASVASVSSLPRLAALRHFGAIGLRLSIQSLHESEPYFKNDSNLKATATYMQQIFEHYADQLTSISWDISNFDRTHPGVQSLDLETSLDDAFYKSTLPKLTLVTVLRLIRPFFLYPSTKLPRVLEMFPSGLKHLDFATCCSPRVISPIIRNIEKLQSLRITFGIADPDNSEFVNDGSFGFWDFVPVLKSFVEQLPIKLQTLHIGVRVLEVQCQDFEEDFYPIPSRWGRILFTRYRWLHSAEISFWTPDPDGNVNFYPEHQAVFRRRPARPGTAGKLIDSLSLVNEYHHQRHRQIERMVQIELKKASTYWHGKDGKEWWFDPKEIESMKFICGKNCYQPREKYFDEYGVKGEEDSDSDAGNDDGDDDCGE